MSFNLEQFYKKVNYSKTFMVIGANTADSPDDLFLNKDVEYCVLIEPLPICFKKIEEKYGNNSKYQLFNCAITNEDVVMEMYTPDDLTTPLIGSSSLVNYKRNGIVLALTEINKDPEKSRVEVISNTLSSIKKFLKITNYDVLQVDTEGCDLIVFNEILKNNITFNVLQLETMWLTLNERQFINNQLTSIGFVLSDDGCNIRAYKE